MLARLEEHDDRQTARLVECAQPPALVRPDVDVVRRLAGVAVGSGLPVAGLFPLDRGFQPPGLDWPVERPRVPLLYRRRLQVIVRSLPELFRCLRHRRRG